jgi:LmbE family N-acetylglucosaminyl deacetylase
MSLVRSERPLLIVSPHLDDALLSAFALTTAQRQVTVLNVFTEGPESSTVITDWDRSAGFTTSRQALDVRRAEDDLAFTNLGVERVALGCTESIYLNDGGAGLEQFRPRLTDWVTAWLAEHPGADVALPAGCGARLRIDHRIRYKIPHRRLGLCGGSDPSTEHVWATDVLLLSIPLSSTVLLYEELPYLWLSRNLARQEQLARQSNRMARHHELAVDMAEKVRRLDAYRSQTKLIFAPWFSPARDLPRRERVTVLQG